MERIKKSPFNSFGFLIFCLIPFSLALTSCAGENKEDGGLLYYYEGSYVDEIKFKTSPGDVNVVLDQINLAPRLKENIPYSLNPAENSADSTKLKLFVSYGNYYPEKPKIFQDISQLNDTVFIWYTNREKILLKRLTKTNSINEPDPKPAYIRIDSVAVYSASNIKLITRTLRKL